MKQSGTWPRYPESAIPSQRPGGSGGRYQGVCQRLAAGGLARISASATFERGKGDAHGDQQARGLLRAHTSDPRLARGIQQTQRRPGADSWLKKLLGRRHKNVATVAVANKNARIAWAILAHGRNYETGYQPQAQ